MPNLNRVTLMGNLTRDPELKPAGQSEVCRITLAISRTRSGKDDAESVDTTFVDAEAWGRTGQAIEQFLRKGDPLLIEGRLQLDRWQDKQGQNRSKLKVVIERFHFVGATQHEKPADAPRQATHRRPQRTAQHA